MIYRQTEKTDGLTELFLKLLLWLKRTAGKLLTDEPINMPKNFQKILQDTRKLIELDQAMTFGIWKCWKNFQNASNWGFQGVFGIWWHLDLVKFVFGTDFKIVFKGI